MVLLLLLPNVVADSTHSSPNNIFRPSRLQIFLSNSSANFNLIGTADYLRAVFVDNPDSFFFLCRSLSPPKRKNVREQKGFGSR